MERFFRRPPIIVAFIAAATLFFALQLPNAKLDNNNFRFVPENDPARLASVRIDEVFGSQIFVLVGLERLDGTILDSDFLKTLRAYTDKLDGIPVVGEVTSIASADYITGWADSIIVEPLLPDTFGGTEGEIAALRDRLRSWDLYKRALVSDDFSATQILVPLEVSAESAGKEEAVEAYRAIKRLAYEAGFEGTRIYVAGMPVFSAVVNEAMSADLKVLIPLVVVVVLVVLFLSFRRIGGIVLPILTVVVAGIWSIGAMALFGVRLSIISTVLPVILAAVGSAYGIHVVSRYYDETAGKRNLSEAEHKRIIFAAMRKIGQPVFLAALTTFAGFVSLCFTPVVPIYEFGIFASFGVVVAYLVSVSLIPALLIIRGAGSAGSGGADSIPAEDRLSAAMASALMAVSRRPRATLLVSAAAAAVSLFGVSRLVIDNVMVEYFKPDTDVVQSDGYIRKHFGGSKSVSVVVSGEKRGDVLDPAVLGAMDGLAAFMERNVPEVGKTSGFTDLVKRINQVFNADESPDGLRPREAVPADASGPGEAAFGFASFDGAAPPSAAEVPAAAGRAYQPIDETRMVALLSKALAESGRPTVSADDLVVALKRATNYQGAAYYEIPTDPARYGKKDSAELKDLISGYLVLLSGDIDSFADDPLEPKSVRMSVLLRTLGQKDTDRALSEVRGYIDRNFPKNVKVEIGGVALVEGALNRLVVRSQLLSVAFSLLMVFLILSVYYRSAAAGLLGLAPLSVSILVNFGVMGLFGIKLNIGTAMIASIAVGTGIDYIIHYTAAYHREHLAAGGAEGFFRRTFLTSGKAILFNALSVGAGFAVLAFSRFNILADLGVLIALAMGTSALSSLTLLPVLLTLAKPAFIRRPLPFGENKTGMEAPK